MGERGKGSVPMMVWQEVEVLWYQESGQEQRARAHIGLLFSALEQGTVSIWPLSLISCAAPHLLVYSLWCNK